METDSISEVINKVYVVSYVANSHDDGLYNEVAVYVDPQMAWRYFLSFYYGSIGEGEQPRIDLDELRGKLVERGESVSVEYTDNYLDDYKLSVYVERLVHTRVKTEESEDD